MQKEEWACGVGAGCLKGSWLYSICSLCGSERVPYMCEAVYYMCVIRVKMNICQAKQSGMTSISGHL